MISARKCIVRYANRFFQTLILMIAIFCGYYRFICLIVKRIPQNQVYNKRLT